MNNHSSNTKDKISIAYLRVSTEEQEKEGFSLDVQKKAALNYSDEHELGLKGNMIFDESKPASTINNKNLDDDLNSTLKTRPVLQNILDMAQQKSFTDLIVFSRDRLTRNFQEFIALRFILQKNNINIHYCRTGETLNSSDNKINRFLDLVLANVAELEANTISIRVKGADRLCIKDGYWAGGKAPLGYKLKKSKIPGRKRPACNLSPVRKDKKKIEEVFAYYNDGYGYRKIAQLMNKIYGTREWTKSKVETIIKNETYTGYITWDRRGGRRSPGKHDTIVKSEKLNADISFISSEDWNTLCKLRNRKNIVKDPKYYSTPFLLKDKLICPKCGKKLKTKNYGKNSEGKYYRVYRCPTLCNGKSELIVNKESIEKKFMPVLCKIIKCTSIDELWELYSKQISKKRKEQGLMIAELYENIKTIDTLKSNIKAIFKENPNKDLQKRLEFQDALLSKTKEQYQLQVSQLKENLSKKFFTNKTEYAEALNRFYENFSDNFFSSKIHPRKRRMLLDIIVDSITLNESGDDIEKILINPPKLST
ncbi:recombinase family protein [Clostridium ganghwense]|uniref:Recombinase family protein n=1 Tax=Clostridium ganghwense TaxID=312089 RepID=A0ABT4CNL9_9CLOT|nr:recombinase family protein [Clostridium ganghwense]MCY6370656.1 recombinase family protein [Clostridium ganghwense]